MEFFEWFILINMKRFLLILLSLFLMSSCHQASKETLILEERDDTMWDDFPCIPFLQCNASRPPIHFLLPACSSLPSIKEWDSIWVTINCNSFWRVQDNKICVDSLDTTSSVWVIMHSKNNDINKNYFYIVGEENDMCRETIERLFNEVYPFMVKASYYLTDECDNIDSVAINNVEFQNGLAKTILDYKFLLFPSQ